MVRGTVPRLSTAPSGLTAESLATPVANAMVALPTDFTMLSSPEFVAGTPVAVIVLPPRRLGINGDTRNPDDYLGLDWGWRKYGGACNAKCGAG